MAVDTLSWKAVLIEHLMENGLTEAEAQSVYLIEMEAKRFFDFSGIMPDCLVLQNIEQDSTQIRYFWTSNSVQARCPSCGELSTKPCKDYYTKNIQDIPFNNKTVYHPVRLNKFFCENPECQCERFFERFDGFTETGARKTNRFVRFCIKRSVESGCHRAEQELRGEGAVISNDTLGRYLKAEASKEIESNIERDDVRVIAADDINLRKGDKSSGCTVLIDAEKHKVLVIIQGTTKEMTMRALDMFPSAEFFSSDRAKSYSSAGKASNKTQVADRFHLIQNAQAAVKAALMANIPARIFIREGDGWLEASSSEDSVHNKPCFFVPDEQVEEYIKMAELTPAKAKKYRNTLKMLELSDRGLKTANIADELGISINDMQALRRTAADTLRYVQDRIKKKVDAQNEATKSREEKLNNGTRKTVGGPNTQSAKASIVEPYRDTVIDMVKSGANHRTIYPVIQNMGYAGSCNAIYQYILKLRKEAPEQLQRRLQEPPPELVIESYPRDKVYSGILHEASKSRPKNEEVSENDMDVSAAKTSSSSERTRSPFSERVTELVLGPAEDDNKEKRQKQREARKKKNKYSSSKP